MTALSKPSWSETPSGGWWPQPRRSPSRGNDGSLPTRSVNESRCECVAHILQLMTDLDPQTTITSIDGVGAFDLISGNAMFEGLLFQMDGGHQHPLLVRMFCGGPSMLVLWAATWGACHGADLTRLPRSWCRCARQCEASRHECHSFLPRNVRKRCWHQVCRSIIGPSWRWTA